MWSTAPYPLAGFLIPVLLVACTLDVHGQDAEPVEVIAFGDSITLGLGDEGVTCSDGPDTLGYPPLLQGLLAQSGYETRVSNHGLCGEITVEGVTRIESVLSEHEADVVLIMEGTNDISTGVGIETMRFNIYQMAQKAADAWVEPVYASVIPLRPDAGADVGNTRTATLGGWLEIDAADAGREFADHFGRMIVLFDLYNRYYSDPYHPNAWGYQILAETWLPATIAAIERTRLPPPCTTTPAPCIEDDNTLCLNEGRFQVRVEWEDFEAKTGVGEAVPLTADTGFFWFFDPDNIELVLKVLDGRVLNDHYWVFYGALSNVAYTITVIDTTTGACKTYENPLRTFASVGDTEAFFEAPPALRTPGVLDLAATHTAGAQAPGAGAPLLPPEMVPGLARIATPARDDTEPPVACADSETVLCLNQGRFQISVTWEDFDGETGPGQAELQTDDTGTFWFFRDSNVELVIKVLDGRVLNDHYWVFYGALSNVAYTIEVVDTTTGNALTYVNPSGTFASVGDTEAFSAP